MAAAAVPTTQDVAVRDDRETALAPVDVTPATVVPTSRRARRASARTTTWSVEPTPAVEAAQAAPEAETAPEPAPEPAAITESIVVESTTDHPFSRWFGSAAESEPAAAADAPAADPADAPEPAPEAEAQDEPCAAADPFLEAVRAFAATGETTVIPQPAPRATGEHVAQGRPARPGRMRRIATTAVASVGVMGIVGMLAIGLTTPVGAVAAPAEGENPAAATAMAASIAPQADEDDIQAFVAPSEVASEALEVTADFDSQTFAEIAAAEGINVSNAVFTNDPTADIQWPFAVGVGISSYYGTRWGRLHEGIDFVPGNGAPVQAIADGTVRIATESGGAYGVNVYIDHVIDGQLVTSHYAHMQYNSLRVTAGQRVKVGDVIGLTGNTGRSYGAHMHFEIIIGGSTIDPLPWLRQWANTHYPEEQVAADVTEDENAGSSTAGD